MRTEPHPRFYTDTTGTVPIAVPALLRTEWWPMISFIVFKAPTKGQTTSSGRANRCADPDAAGDRRFHLVPMNEEEAAEREMRARRIHASRPTLPQDTTWTSDTDTVFDGTYRHLLRAAKSDASETGIKRRRDGSAAALLHLQIPNGGDGGGDDDGVHAVADETAVAPVMVMMMVVMM